MKFRKYLNIFIIVMVILNWLRMMFGFSIGGLTAKGFRTLKYFTILSNLFEAYASFIWLYKKNEKLKYIAAISVALTFLTVLLFLGPLFGFRFVYIGSNFWFHLIIPLIAVIEVILFNNQTFSNKDNLFGLIPVLLYGVFYIGNVLINGIGQWPNNNDWYGFFSWGYLASIMIIIILTLATYFIGFVIRRINNKYKDYINKK